MDFGAESDGERYKYVSGAEADGDGYGGWGEWDGYGVPWGCGEGGKCVDGRRGCACVGGDGLGDVGREV